MWTWQQACAWHLWRDPRMVDLVAPKSGDDDNTFTVERLLADQKKVRQRLTHIYPRSRFPRPSQWDHYPSGLTPDRFPEPIGSVAAFEHAAANGLVMESEFNMFDPAEQMRVFPPRIELGALGIPTDDALDDIPAPNGPLDRGPAEARMPEPRPIPQSPTGEFKKRRLERRADIEAAIDWCLVDRAIELVARRRDISLEGAWDAIKLNISLGQLPAQCIDDRSERVPLEPHWIELLAKFQLPTEPGTLDQPIGTIRELAQFSDFPSGGILWFDRRRTIENRLARKITEDNRAEPSLPPDRVRNVVVDGVRLDGLYPENAAAFEGTAEASAQTEGFVVNGEATTPKLSGKKLDAALDEWANNRWGPDFIKLPGREDLLRLARLEFKGSRITRDHARELRVKHATKEAKAGGSPTHKPPTNR